MCRHKQLALPALFHTHKTLVPPLDDPSGTKDELKGFPAIVRGIKECSVIKKPIVVSDAKGTPARFFSVSDSVIDDFKFFHLPIIVAMKLQSTRRICEKLGVFRGGLYDRDMNKLMKVLFFSGVVFGGMAMLPDGNKSPSAVNLPVESPEPSLSLPVQPSLHVAPLSGEPSDSGLTKTLHREFREALDRDPLVAIELARQYVFTKELDPTFRVEILRELKMLQFTHAEVSELASDILEKAPDPALYEEALTIKYASMEPEEFETLVSEMAEKTDVPEYQVILHNFGGPEKSLN